MKRVLPILLIASLFVGCSGKEKEAHSPKGKAKAKVLVETYKVKRTTVRKTLTHYGVVSSEKEAYVVPDIPGRIKKFMKREGEWVKKDSIIAILEREVTGLEFKDYPLKSPIDGVLVKLFAKEGEMVAPQTPVAQIVDPSKLTVEVELPQSDLKQVKVGMKCEIQLDNRKIEGMVSQISPSIDPMKRTSTLKIKLTGRAKLTIGAMVRTTIILEEHKNTFAVPEKAIVKENEETYVFVVKYGAAVKKKVRTGLKERGMVEIVEGIEEGDEVVTLGARGLEDGQPVEVRRVEK